MFLLKTRFRSGTRVRHEVRILLVPSVFGRLFFVFGRLQNPVPLVLSSTNGRFGRTSKPFAF